MKNPVRCLFVDDEPLARRHMIRALENREDIVVVGETGSHDEAVRAVAELRPELLLLDVAMPSGDAFELLNALSDPPYVTFVTAHDRFAIRAFEVNALDYLLKPLDRDRLDAAIARAVHAIRGGGRQATSTPRLDAQDIALVEVGRSGHFVSVARILAIESHGNHTRITLDEGPQLVARQPVKHWVNRLPPELFVQLGRGLVVNVRQIKMADVAARDAVLVLGEREHTIRLGAAAITRLREVLPR